MRLGESVFKPFRRLASFAFLILFLSAANANAASSPVITSPMDGDVVTTDTPLVVGTSDPSVTIRVYVGGSVLVNADGAILVKAGDAPALLIADLPAPDPVLLSTQLTDFRPI